MTDKEKFENVKTEIKRLKEIAEYNLSHSKMDRSAWMQQASVCTNLLSFIDSMQEEPVNDELEKVVEEIVDPTVLNAYGAKEIANRLRRTVIESINRDLEGWHVL